MTPKPRPPRPSSYAWARHLDATDVTLDDLSPAAREGHELALELAEDAYDRTRDPRDAAFLQPLTLEQLAADCELSEQQAARWIALARRQLFGTLTDDAIYKRLRRQKGRNPRRCAETTCRNPIPVTAPTNKKYCDTHATTAARVHRHRQSRQAGQR